MLTNVVARVLESWHGIIGSFYHIKRERSCYFSRFVFENVCKILIV
jgi:hypothetical protein